MVKYNKDNKVFCKFCDKSFNEKYFLRHSRKARHLRLVEEFENKELLKEINKEKEIRGVIEKYGLNEVRNIVDKVNIENYLKNEVVERRIVLFKKQF